MILVFGLRNIHVASSRFGSFVRFVSVKKNQLRETTGRLILTSFPSFSPTRPYGARERRETLAGSGHVVPEQINS